MQLPWLIHHLSVLVWVSGLKGATPAAATQQVVTCTLSALASKAAQVRSMHCIVLTEDYEPHSLTAGSVTLCSI